MMDESFHNIVKKRQQERKEAYWRIFEKYDREHPIDDVVDLQTMTIVENRGHLQNMKAVRFGAKLSSSSNIEQYIKELEEEKKRDSLSVVSRSHTQMGKKSSLSWDEADMQDDEASDLLCEILPKGQKSSRQVFKNMLESFQSCAENLIGEVFDANRQNPETFGGCMDMSFGKKKCSWKNSLFCGNQQWDITLQVSASDKVPSQGDIYASSPVEPVFRNVFSTDMKKSFLMNLLQLMRMPSHISLIQSTSLKGKSKSPMCHILTVESNGYVGKEMSCFKNVRSKNLKAINYTPVKSTSVHLDASIPLSMNGAIHTEEKLYSYQKPHSKNLKAINYSPVKSTLHQLNASTSLGMNDASYAKEKFFSNLKSHSKNLKAINYTPIKSSSVPMDASIPLCTTDAICPEEKLCSNQKRRSKNLKAINYSPAKSTSTHPNITTPLGKNDASYAKEKLCSNQKFDSKNLKDINFSPVNSTSVHLNISTPSRKRCFVADDELSILKAKKVCNKKESNAAKSNEIITGRKSKVGPCITPSVEEHNQLPLCDLFKTPDTPVPSRKSLKITAATTPKEHKSNVKDFNNISICMLENNP